MNKDIEAPVQTENTALLTSGHTDAGRRSGGCCRRLLFLGRLLLHLGCFGYSLYLIWLLAYLKANPYYWLLSLIPFIFNLLLPFIGILDKKISSDPAIRPCFCKIFLKMPSVGVTMHDFDDMFHNANSPRILPSPAGRIHWTPIYHHVLTRKHRSDFLGLLFTERRKTGRFAQE